jgi:hypothetical protein
MRSRSKLIVLVVIAALVLAALVFVNRLNVRDFGSAALSSPVEVHG